MRRLCNRRFRFDALVLAVLLMVVVGPSRGRAQVHPAPPGKPKPDARATSEFSVNVQRYVKLHQQMESSLRKLKPTKNAANIDSHQQELANKIAGARMGAKQGEIFSANVTAYFRRLLAREFHGPQATAAHKTIHEGAPVQVASLKVNTTYPDGVPFTTVPPTLLLKLPQLPPEVEYRIVGQYLVLLDVRANLIVDYIPRAVPGNDAK